MLINDNHLIKKRSNYEKNIFIEYYADDLIGLPNMMPMIKGKEAAIEADKEMDESDINITSFNLNTVEVFKGGKYVFEVGTWYMVMEIPGMLQPWKDKGKYVSIWEVWGGDLKLKLDIWNTDINPWEEMKKMQKPHHEGTDNK